MLNMKKFSRRLEKNMRKTMRKTKKMKINLH
jgi:hypothetical protein